MYSQWASLAPVIDQNVNGSQSKSVLNKFSMSCGKDVALTVIKQIASTFSVAQPTEPSPLTTDQEVLWCMDVICYGLSLPLTEHETIKDCVNVYCEWLTGLHPQPKISVPKPVLEDSNLYARRIINHLHNLFTPRQGESADTINRQVLHCHRVLRTLQETVKCSTILTRETWETVLLFLLAINDILLSPPVIKDDVSDQLCERLLSTLFEVWMLACVKCFPSPSLWKTFQESCAMWRHRISLIDQWNRVNLILTSRLLAFTYGPTFPELKILPEDDVLLMPKEATDDCIAQSWYRFLRIIGSPTALCCPQVISNTPQFIQNALLQGNGQDPSAHPCLLNLPQIFLKSIKGIACLVDAFLGLSKGSLIGLTTTRSSSVSHSSHFSGTSSASMSMASLNQEVRAPAAERPKCNSILHLFGEWLFEAAHIGSEMWVQNTKKQATEASRRPSSMIVDSRKGSISLSQPSSLTEPVETPSGLTIDKFESGKAEAIGALCRIFAAKKTGEEIIPVYLARFYVALQQGLRISESREIDETMASIIYNSGNLFKIDLDGIHVLLPSFINALDLLLPEKDPKFKPPNMVINKTELRKSAINILLSILVLPCHFGSLPIRELGVPNPEKTFIQFKPQLINILMNALQVETDPQNTHMLLGGLLLTVQDAVTFEETENPDPFHASPPPAESNLLSSACSEKSAYSVASAASNSSYGANVTATLSNHDSVSLTMSDDFPSDLLHDFEASSLYDSGHALFVRATYLVCHRLISSWKTELNVSLAALELLSGLARMSIKESDSIECKRAVKWICDYISYQCSRPPPAHSKDLHSTIVAAFQCLSVWLMQHPYLLQQDKDCLNIVLEVVELGISGSKSVGKPNESVKLKDEKELKPVSMRVRDSAETLLTLILEQVGYFPNSCGPHSLSSLLDEVALIKHCKADGAAVTHEQAVHKFKYFVTENSTILALLEEPLGNDQDPQPTVTLLIRSSFGRHSWTMQLRHLPRSKSGTKYHASGPLGRPIPMNEIPMPKHVIDQKFFPEGVDRIPNCIADDSIPTLDSILQKTGNQFYKLLDEQMVHEKLCWAETECSEDSLSHCPEETAPTVCSEFQASRLLLSHFGFLSFGDDSNQDELTPNQSLTVLDTSKVSFANDLKTLDKMSPRTCDTVHIFYVRAGQCSEREIIGNMSEENAPQIDPHFWQMLNSLGWNTRVKEHAGWTGQLETSWKIGSQASNVTTDDDVSSPLSYNGTKNIIYWADVSSELAFVVPNYLNKEDNDSFDGQCMSSEHGGHYERSLSEEKNKIPPTKLSATKPRTLSLDLDKPQQPQNQAPRTSEPVAPMRRRGTTNKPTIFGTMNTKMFLIWLESYEDFAKFPAEQLLPYTRTGEEAQTGIIPRAKDCHLIFLHPLNNGLMRIKLIGPVGRVNFATPLIDGMILSKRVVGNLVRQTCLNMSRRRRLENDVYQPPHVRRRVKVQEMVQKYKIDMNEPELLAYLFRSTN
ncbi:ral GTPase-activating protein subunit beta isoform X2 [Culicoides brevitarsis]|uniref:ral GTPase-activating protein subunit beta isoform X2 n=1 Tax=Culicoides brevitarsis TaxID=469753 RepID=UPI00307C60AC